MEIIGRRLAKQLGLNHYFTGKPCKNGHVSIRYTQSGTCYGCLQQSNAAINPTKTINLVPFKVRLFETDRDLFCQTLLGMCVARDAAISMKHIDRGGQGANRASGTALYSFYCHSDDVGGLRAFAAALCAAHAPNIEETRNRVLDGAAAYLPPDSTPPMNFN